MEKRYATKTKNYEDNRFVQVPRPTISSRDRHRLRGCTTCAGLLYAQQDQALAPAAANEETPPIPADQLDSLVAPIALYPDPLLAQTLAARRAFSSCTA